MTTIKQAADAAAREIDLLVRKGNMSMVPFSVEAMFPVELGIIIEAHFAPFEQLRVAAVRAEGWFAQERFNREILVKALGRDTDAVNYVAEIANELTALRSALNGAEEKPL